MNCLRYNFLLLMHSALTPSPLAACRDGRRERERESKCMDVSVEVCVCVLEEGKGLGGDDDETEGVFCPQPVSSCLAPL